MIQPGRIIKACRKFRKMTQRDQAEASHISRQSIWHIENGAGTNIVTFEALLNAMGFRIDIAAMSDWKDWRQP